MGGTLLCMKPGPSDSSVLYMQSDHRSQSIWEFNESEALRCRRREAVVQRTMKLHRRIIPYLQQSGFYRVARLGFISLDWHLITAFVERWRPETHTFHLLDGECTITLQDVAIQLGLPVDGTAVSGTSLADWSQVCEDLLGGRPNNRQLTGSRLNLSWLASQFPPLTDDDEFIVQRYARAYILQFIGGFLFADKSNNLVHLMFLPLLEDFRVVGQYSWGSACLTWLYREMCRACLKDAHEIAGPLILLQIWAWDRFPHLAPSRLQRLVHADVDEVGLPLPPPPLGIRWRDSFCVTEQPTHVLTQYRFMLDCQTPDQVVWQPYSDVISNLPDYCINGKDIWQTVSPLICFHIVEWHKPDRVMRQFGITQTVPEPCDTELSLHSIDLRGRHELDWQVEHHQYIKRWNVRRDNIARNAISQEDDDSYYNWYMHITRRYISRQ